MRIEIIYGYTGYDEPVVRIYDFYVVIFVPMSKFKLDPEEYVRDAQNVSDRYSDNVLLILLRILVGGQHEIHRDRVMK